MNKKKQGRYFGNYSFINITVSKLVFWALKHRRKQLIRSNKKTNKPVQLINTDETKKDFQKFLDLGFTKISIGGGAKNLQDFINIDFVKHQNVEREVVANILDLSFIPESSVTFIHSNHVIEHLTQEQLEQQLEQYQRILTNDGAISIRCPNALGVAYGFFFGQVAEREHEEFLKLGFPKDEDFYNKDDGWYYRDLWALYHWFYAFTGNIENEHLNQLTPTKLKDTVEKAGFSILKMVNPEASNLVLIAKKST
jgi:hypothetical protein